MPEGDVLFRTARTLSRRLEGRTVLRCTSNAPSVAKRDDLVGRTVTRVHAYGKYVLIHLAPHDAEGGKASDELVLRTHLKMNGSWHVYRPGEAFRMPAWQARLVIEVAPSSSDRDTIGCVAVCFAAPVVELVRAKEAEIALRELGPDLLAESFDLDAVTTRLAAYDGPIGVALMDQRVVAGIGNVYKSELLFIHRVDPFVHVTELDRTTLHALLETARRLLQENVAVGTIARGGAFRRTRRAPGSPHWVYERSGSPCLRCGAIVRMRRQGILGRSTYFCPQCQSIKL